MHAAGRILCGVWRHQTRACMNRMLCWKVPTYNCKSLRTGRDEQLAACQLIGQHHATAMETGRPYDAKHCAEYKDCGFCSMVSRRRCTVNTGAVKSRKLRKAPTPSANLPLVNLVAMSGGGGAALNAATVRGDGAAVAALLAQGVSPDYCDTTHNGAFPLHRCAWRGFPEIAEDLLKAGATVDCKNTNGATPLMNTAITNRPDVAKVLLKYGADRSLTNAEGKTALDIARGSSSAVAALLAGDNKEL
eukprot:720023-Prymnesium_polylepis.1